MIKLTQRKPELLAPAGNLEKLKTAVHFGADAVYFGGKNFSLRNHAGNFTIEEMDEGIKFARQNNVKTYITCNIFPRTEELDDISQYLKELNNLKPDALIIADPGILRLAKINAPDLDIHLSTQANTTNVSSIKFWEDLGVSRVNLARELSLEDISLIRKNTDIELETFVHGAMCVSYSGRCLLSGFMSGRSSNHGECSHPCRWKYRLEEEMRPNEYYPIEEDARGTYIFNSKDLCMLQDIEKFFDAGVDSLKIEGRMKGIFYLGSVVKVYREAIDYYFSEEKFKIKQCWIDILNRVANRVYSTGFYLNDPDGIISNFSNIKPDNVHNFLGDIQGLENNGYIVGVRNKFSSDDKIKILSPDHDPEPLEIKSIKDLNGNIKSVAQPNDIVIIEGFNGDFQKGDLLFKS